VKARDKQSEFSCHCKFLYCVVRITAFFFYTEQSSCAFRTARILLHVNARNDDLVGEKINNFVAVIENDMLCSTDRYIVIVNKRAQFLR